MAQTNTKFPVLYTRASTGALRYWSTEVVQEGSRVYIVTDYGQLGGKGIVGRKEILTAKSRSSLFEQGVFEAQKTWNDKQKKNGYTSDVVELGGEKHGAVTRRKTPPGESAVGPETPAREELTAREKPAARAGTKTASSLRFLPMLANKFQERKKYVKYPAVAQPKIDGVRASARLVEGGAIEMRSRRDTVFPFFDEIKGAVKELGVLPGVVLDGEIYSRLIPFRVLNGHCNRKLRDGKHGFDAIPQAERESIHYQLFDCYFEAEPLKPFSERYAYLESLFSAKHHPLVALVPNIELSDEAAVQGAHDRFVEQGYEGAIIRNTAGVYRLKLRSNDLLKFKTFQDAEFEITGATAAVGNKEDGCIVWELKTRGGDVFSCRPTGSLEERRADWREYSAHPENFVGQMYTVKFQETYENGVPRFPTGIGFRGDS